MFHYGISQQLTSCRVGPITCTRGQTTSAAIPDRCDLTLSVKTIEAHKFNLMRKLDIHNKAQLVQYAIQKKIIQLPGIERARSIDQRVTSDVARAGYMHERRRSCMHIEQKCGKCESGYATNARVISSSSGRDSEYSLANRI